MASSPESLTGITQGSLNFEDKHFNDLVHHDFEVADYGAIVEEQIRESQPILHTFLYKGTMLPENIDIDAYKAGIAYAINILPDSIKREPIPSWIIEEIQAKILRHAIKTEGRIDVDLRWNTEKLEIFEPQLHRLIMQSTPLFNDSSEIVAFKLGLIYGSMPYCLKAQTLAFPDQPLFEAY